MKKVFITGVDTDIGKTFVSLGLCLAQEKKGLNVGYFKPFQSGAYIENGKKQAPDVVEIKKYSSIPTGFSYLLEGEVSPYLASKAKNIIFDINKVKDDIEKFSSGLDSLIVEGAGGLYCPVSKGITFCDIIEKFNMPTVIVTTPKLGRLNHTLMTLECAQNKGLDLKGIIINRYPKNPNQSEKSFIEELKDFTKIPILATIPELDSKFKRPDKTAILEAFSSFDI